MARPSGRPVWREWPDALVEWIGGAGVVPENAIIVGHGSSAAPASRLAADIGARGVVVLDGPLPSSGMHATLFEPWFTGFLQGLPSSGGFLPPVTQWFDFDVMGEVPMPEDTRRQFLADLPRISLSCLQDTFELPEIDRLNRYYVRTSQVYEDDAALAQAAGWNVLWVEGTHLDPMFRPVEMAGVIAGIHRDLGRM